MKYSGDWAALLRSAYRKQVVCVPERLTYWRMHGSNTSTRNERQALEEARLRKAILAHERHWFESGSDRNLVQRRLTLGTMDLVSILIYLGDMATARRIAPALLRIGHCSPQAIKRAAYGFLPRDVARRRLWGQAAQPLSAPYSHDFRDFPSIELLDR